jgi:hypothetical protein
MRQLFITADHGIVTLGTHVVILAHLQNLHNDGDNDRF